MRELVPYLTFAGNCEEAIHFYKDAMGGEIVTMQRFGDSPMDTPEEQKNKVLHCIFKAEGVYIMASDTMPDHTVVSGNNTALSIDFKNADDEKAVFDKLSLGANITMPLQDTFWGATFGMLTDRFGINWMFNYDKPQG